MCATVQQCHVQWLGVLAERVCGWWAYVRAAVDAICKVVVCNVTSYVLAQLGTCIRQALAYAAGTKCSVAVVITTPASRAASLACTGGPL